MVKRNYKVRWDDAAKASLRRIYNYIKNKESVDQAILVRNEIRDLAKSLGLCPANMSQILLLKVNLVISDSKPSGVTRSFMK